MEPHRFGKFLLIEQIAAGGMAEIYKAVGVAVGGQPQTLAIKRILPQFSNDDEFISLLVDEAKLMVFLNHPNVVPIIEFGKVEDSYYIAMDYVEGTTLKGLYKRVREQNQQFTIDMACHIVREIGSGLAYANRKTGKDGKPLQIVHRDISPANILISYDGEVKIADFGISKAATQGHRTQIGVIRGKTGYMSPEQTRSGETIDHRSDLYSLGIIFWELLTGERLYVADSVPEALAMIRKSQVPPPSKLRPAVSPQLDAVVLKALTADQKDRYQKGEEMVDAINEFLGRFAPGGRPVRVTHTDLVGFLRRYYAGEMEAALTATPLQLDQIITKVETFTSKTALFGGKEKELTKPETIAQNPLFELSAPEHAVSIETHVTTPSGASSEPTIPDSTASLIEAPAGVVETARRIPPIVVTLIIATFLVASAVFAIFRHQKSRPKEDLPKGNVTVTISSEPDGAEILVDGQSKNQQTPAKVEVPAGRNVRITLQKSGFVSETREINPQGAGMWPISFKLAEDKTPKIPVGKVRIITDPAGARVFLDGKQAEGKSPFELDVELGKKVVIRVEADGYKPKETSVQVDKEGDKIEKAFFLSTLPPSEAPGKRIKVTKVEPPRPLGPDKKPVISRPAMLGVITFEPPDAEVSLDGTRVPRDIPFVGFSVSAGKRQLVISAKGEKVPPYKTVIDFTPGRSVTCRFNFKTREGGCS